jgi:diguanylate cyclase (GGDEF)-like protein
MADSVMAPRAVAGIRRLWPPTRWALLGEAPIFIAYALLVEATVLTIVTTTAFVVPLYARDWIVLGVLAGLGVLQAELGHGVERLRRRLHRTPHINLTSVWTGAAVMLLPPPLIAALVALLYAHLALRSWYGLRNTPPFRSTFNASLAIISSCAAYRVLTWMGVDGMRGALDLGWRSLGGIAAAILAYFVVAAFIVLPGLKPERLTRRELFGDTVDNGLELATLLAGVLAALALVTLSYLIVALIALLFFVHRGVLSRQLEALAETDEKTGLCNTRGWYRLATETLSRAEREQVAGALVVIEVDRFKEISDEHGHLAADEVLNAIADKLRANVRDYDAIGRLTGAEFVILLPDLTTDDAMQVAEDIRQAVFWLRVPIVNTHKRTTHISGLTVSIGVAPYPAPGFAIHKLLSKANIALDTAKGLGHNRVQLVHTA